MSTAMTLTRSVAAGVLLIALSRLAAAEPEVERRTMLSVETSPMDLALDGYSLGVAILPRALPHWRFGASTYALDLPSFIIELDEDNEGWEARLTHGFDMSASYSFAPSGAGWFIGGLATYERFEYRLDGAATDGANLGAIVAAGTTWLPFGHGLFVRPFIGAAVVIARTGSRTLGDRTFSDPPVKPLAIIHVGYQF